MKALQVLGREQSGQVLGRVQSGLRLYLTDVLSVEDKNHNLFLQDGVPCELKKVNPAPVAANQSKLVNDCLKGSCFWLVALF